MLNVWRLLLSEYWIHITYYSVLVIFRWVCNMWCTGNTAKKKHTVIQSHEFASFFLILLVHFLEIFNEWFFIHGHALRSRQLFTGTSVALVSGISAVLRGSLAFILLLSTRQITVRSLDTLPLVTWKHLGTRTPLAAEASAQPQLHLGAKTVQLGLSMTWDGRKAEWGPGRAS